MQLSLNLTTVEHLNDVLLRDYFRLLHNENDGIWSLNKWIQIINDDHVRQRCLSLIQDNNLTEDDFKIILLSAISSLQLYVIQNFVCQISHNESFDDNLNFIDDFFKHNQTNSDYDFLDGTSIYASARNANLLKFSRFIFENLEKKISDQFKKNQTEYLHYKLWLMRSAIIHQISLSSPTGTLYNEILNHVKLIESCLENEKDFKIENCFRLSLYTEIANIFIWFGDQENSKKYFSLAKQHSDITFDLIGCLGMRTQFQTKPVSQLMVNLKRNGQIDPEEPELKPSISMPNNVKSDDQELLQEVKFLSEKSNEESNIQLRPIEQALMVTWIKFSHRFGSSGDKLLREELLTYVYFLLQHCDHWIMQFVLLEMRSLFEQTNRRLVERSMMQLQALVDTINNPGESSQANQRMFYFYSVLSSPIWKIEKHHADLLCSLGLYKSAVDFYSHLKLWNDVIECYRKMGLLERAERIVREKIAENDLQPDMHCLLGEITGDIECYHYSWKISNGRYAKAQKMLGLHYFKIQDYDKALDCFWNSVNINSMQIDVWFRMGYIGLLQQDWNLAVTAYRRVLQFDNDSFEAWNNLSKAYIKLGDKERAMKTLQEAIKCNFENWKIWENYIAVCADLGEVSEMIESWHRLIDIKGQYLDDEVADILVKCVQHDQNRLMNKSLELFARITSTSPGTAKIWHLYARLLIMANRDEDITKIDQCLQKSQRLILSTGWEKNVDKILNVLDHNQLISEDIFHLIQMQKNPESSRNILYSFKLSLNSVITLVNKSKQDLLIAEQDKSEQLERKLEAIQEIYNQIVNKLNQFN